MRKQNENRLPWNIGRMRENDSNSRYEKRNDIFQGMSMGVPIFMHNFKLYPGVKAKRHIFCINCNKIRQIICDNSQN